jgi:hypothetical protein
VAVLLLLRPHLQVDFMIDETLPRMVAWGLLQQQGPQQYSLMPLPQALDNLTAYWQRMQQPAAAATDGPSSGAAGQHEYSLLAGQPAAAAAAAEGPGRLQATAAGAAWRVAAGCVSFGMGFAGGLHHHGGGCGCGARGVLAPRMPAQQLQKRCVVPCRLARGVRCAAAAAAAQAPARQGLVAAGRAGMWA